MKTPLEQWMRVHDGIQHSSRLRAADYTVHEVRREIAAGRMLRVRRSWLITPECSAERRAAAAAGGRVTCVSAARARQLWTEHDDPRIHVGVAASAARNASPGILRHWGQGPIPVPAAEVEEPLINVLFHTARCLEPAQATAVWESALRMQLISLEELSHVAWRSSAAHELVQTVSQLADSGVETRFVLLMRARGVAVRQQVWLDGHPVDALIGERLVVQIDGFAHHGSARDRRRDLRADARLALRGYTVLRFDYQQIMHDPEYVRQTVLNAIAQRLHLAY